jgi:hypothetical protein
MKHGRIGRREHQGHYDRAGERATVQTPLAWYRWYPGDFLRVVRGWPFVARGVFRELLDAQWDLGELPTAPGRLRDLVGLSAAEWTLAWKFCAPHFPRSATGRRNPKLEDLRAMQVALVERCHRAGRAGARARWGTRATVVPLRPGVDDA